MPTMKIASALSQADSPELAVEDCLHDLKASLDQVDLMFVFASAIWADRLQSLLDKVNSQLQPAHVIGCTGESILGQKVEVELSPGLSLWAAQLPGVELEVNHVRYQATADGSVFHGLPAAAPTNDHASPCQFLLGDPYTFPPDLFFHHSEDAHPKPIPIVGGMASGMQPDSIRVIVNDTVHTDGAALLSVNGPVHIESLVSQGCRPVGQHFVITRAERNVIFELGGKPAAEQLDKVFREAANREQKLMQRGLQIGRVISEYQDRFEQGDFLVRGVSGVQPDGSLVVQDYMRTGQTVQFHVRDADTADAELREMLAARKASSWAGALAFTCNGRGTRLFPEEHHDARVIAEQLNNPPLAGFFAQGELGPVGGHNFVHGYTASIALWRDA